MAGQGRLDTWRLDDNARLQVSALHWNGNGHSQAARGFPSGISMDLRHNQRLLEPDQRRQVQSGASGQGELTREASPSRGGLVGGLTGKGETMSGYIQPKPKSHLGLQFIDENGMRHESWQLLNAAGYAIATADFVGVKLIRFLYADSAELDAKEWVVELGGRMTKL